MIGQVAGVQKEKHLEWRHEPGDQFQLIERGPIRCGHNIGQNMIFFEGFRDEQQALNFGLWVFGEAWDIWLAKAEEEMYSCDC